MIIDRIKSRLDLLNKITSAFKEAETSGIKDPVKIQKKALKNRANLKIEKSRHNKTND